ncbi:hypothetical protein A6A04_20685 [Paramagnetospirillum marisnigri]|uniref:DUF805 domain-containing protein n=1 Tax=Paramagnetospirillum marisnigri TaxID=1285242 RepID=A0A178MBV9_9PROT|nr:DUF805 domain-containing protein [Paramagnetospirillum marisnigri]OAN46242.1 hypothetical protein A6A04_20685 [Paramagnetospirillum marisnigri]
MSDSNRTALAHAIHDHPFLSAAYLRFLFLSFDGRIGRASYWGSAAFWIAVLFLVSVALALLPIPETVMAAVPILILAVVLLTLLPVQIKRLHDRDRPWWWIILNIIPLANFWLVIELGFLPGVAGNNRHGPPPGHPALSPEETKTRFDAGQAPSFASPRDQSICIVLHGLESKTLPDGIQHRDIELLWLTALGLAYEGRPLDRFGDIPMPGLVHDIRPYLCLVPDEDLARMMAALDSADTMPELRLMFPDSLWETAA